MLIVPTVICRTLIKVNKVSISLVTQQTPLSLLQSGHHNKQKKVIQHVI